MTKVKLRTYTFTGSFTINRLKVALCDSVGPDYGLSCCFFSAVALSFELCWPTTLLYVRVCMYAQYCCSSL